MENKQIIISLGREFGSCGHIIAEELSKRFNLPLYDSNILKEIAELKNIDVKELEKYDEIPKNKFFSRSVNGYSNSPEENIAQIQFDYIRKKAAGGESFIIVGRCSEEILKEYKCLTTIFILGDMDKKIEHVSEKFGLSPREAEAMIIKNNKKRKTYHNHYCKGKWGDSRNYELSINAGRIGIDASTDIIEKYIREKMKLL